MLQPVLILLQLFLIDAMSMETDAANRIRVLSTALPMLFSMFFILKRNFKITIVTYSIVSTVLLFTVMAFPGRWAYMSNDVTKFTLPVVIPTGLCIVSVHNFAVLAKNMQYISFIAAAIGVLYVSVYLAGGFIIDNYSMSFSYALLFPTFIMITKRSWICKCIAIVLMVEMLAIGSRGALLLSIAYWLFSICWGKVSYGRIIFYLLAITAGYMLFFDSLINLLANFFDAIGIQSRTLRLLLDDELVSHDSGRDLIYQQTWWLIEQNPLWGNGVWADRQYLEMYCHNVFLELLLDFGYVGAGIILCLFFIKQVRIFRRIPPNHKTIYLMMLGIICPLFASSSYLISFNVGMFLGFSYLQIKMYENGLYQDYEFK